MGCCFICICLVGSCISYRLNIDIVMHLVLGISVTVNGVNPYALTVVLTLSLLYIDSAAAFSLVSLALKVSMVRLLLEV